MTLAEYVEERNGAFYVAGSRVSLASVIFDFRGGASPESIRQDFPSLSLAQVYGAVAFYLNHPDACEVYLQGLDAKWKDLERRTDDLPEALRIKLAQARERLLAFRR
jgi:uncharacterized protein (DUF433 family)